MLVKCCTNKLEIYLVIKVLSIKQTKETPCLHLKVKVGSETVRDWQQSHRYYWSNSGYVF